MINLLPTEYRDSLHYARFNSLVRRWLLGIVAVIGGLILILAVGWIYLGQQINNLNSSVAGTNQELQNQKLSEVQKQADQINQNVKTINKVLASEIRFSDLLKEIGNVMPAKTVLGSLSLGKVDGAIDLSANAKDYSSATQIAINLSDPKKNIFEKVDIVNISCSVSSTNEYPCSGTFKALFSKNIPSRFLSVAKDGNQ